MLYDITLIQKTVIFLFLMQTKKRWYRGNVKFLESMSFPTWLEIGWKINIKTKESLLTFKQNIPKSSQKSQDSDLKN